VSYIEINVPIAKASVGKGSKTYWSKQRFYVSVLRVKVKKPDHECIGPECPCVRRKR